MSSHATFFLRQPIRLLLTSLLLLPLAAHAGREILLDVPNSDYSLNGQFWGNYTTSTTFSNTLGGVVIGTSETIQPSGIISYSGGVFFFEPLGLASGQFVLNPTDSLSAIGINVGQVDARVFDPTLVNDHSSYTNPYNAARYNFNDVCLNAACTGGTFTFQVIDIRLAPTVDVLEFNYAISQAPAGATSSFSAGPYSATFTPATGPELCLSNGVQTVFASIQACAAGVTTSVPEPDSNSLLLAGGLGLALLGLSRRRFSQGGSMLASIR